MNTKQSGLLLLKTCQDTHKAGTHRRLSISRSRCSSPLLQGCGRACFSCASVWKSHQGTRGVRVCQWMSRRMARHVQRALLHARTHPARPYTRIAHAHADTRIHTQTPMRAHTHTHTHTHARMYACAHKQPPPPPSRARALKPEHEQPILLIMAGLVRACSGDSNTYSLCIALSIADSRARTSMV